MTIEDKIRAKKEEIKRVNRELSRLQGEARAKNDPMKIQTISVNVSRNQIVSNRYTIEVNVQSNKFPNPEKIRLAIESLSESSKPKSPIDWSNPEYDDYNWAAIDKDGRMGLYKNMPRVICGDTWTDEHGWKRIVIKPWASWDKSLIHRPGVKE